MRQLTHTDEPLVTSTNNSRIAKGRKLMEMMLNHYWERWRKEQCFLKQKHSTRILLKDVVLIYDEKQPRHLENGEVENLLLGRHGRARGAEVNKWYQFVTNTMKDDDEVGAEANPACPDEMNVANVPGPKSCHSLSVASKS